VLERVDTTIGDDGVERRLERGSLEVPPRRS